MHEGERWKFDISIMGAPIQGVVFQILFKLKPIMTILAIFLQFWNQRVFGFVQKLYCE